MSIKRLIRKDGKRLQKVKTRTDWEQTEAGAGADKCFHNWRNWAWAWAWAMGGGGVDADS
jgi:hypothetical protein